MGPLEMDEAEKRAAEARARSEEALVCPWLKEALVVGACIAGVKEITGHHGQARCIREKCAMWSKGIPYELTDGKWTKTEGMCRRR